MGAETEFVSYSTHPSIHTPFMADLTLNFRVLPGSGQEFNEEIDRIISTILDKDSELRWSNPLRSEVDRLKLELTQAKNKIAQSECEHKYKHAATDPCFGVMYLYCEKCGQAKTNNVFKTT